MSKSRLFQVITVPFSRRYRFITSFLFFFFVAIAYLYFSPTRYRVSINLVLPNVSENFVDTVKSKNFVQKAIDQLPFCVSYYAENTPDKEEFENDLPVIVVVNDAAGDKYDKKLVISSVSSHSYSIEHEDTIQYFELNASVNQYFGKFKVVRGPAFNSHFKPLLISFNNQNDIYREYQQNLQVKQPGLPNALILSTVTSNPAKGRVFLHKLLELYNAKNPSGSDLINTDSLQLLQHQITVLRSKVNEKAKLIARAPAPGSQQIKTLQTIKPYLETPVRQFVQVPYAEEVENTALRADIDLYNKAELVKQRLLSEVSVDDLAVINVDTQLSKLKVKILGQVDLLSGKQDQSVKSVASPMSPDRELQAALVNYNNLSTRHQNSSVSNDKGFVKIVGNPQGNIVLIQPNAFLIGSLVLVLSISVPLLCTLVGILTESIARKRWFNNQNLIEKIKILIGTEQID